MTDRAHTLPLDQESEELLSEGEADARAYVAEACSRTKGTRHREEIRPLIVVVGGMVVETAVTGPLKRNKRTKNGA